MPKNQPANASVTLYREILRTHDLLTGLLTAYVRLGQEKGNNKTGRRAGEILGSVRAIKPLIKGVRDV
jgi:pyruvate-formate lyase